MTKEITESEMLYANSQESKTEFEYLRDKESDQNVWVNTIVVPSGCYIRKGYHSCNK